MSSIIQCSRTFSLPEDKAVLSKSHKISHSRHSILAHFREPKNWTCNLDNLKLVVTYNCRPKVDFKVDRGSPRDPSIAYLISCSHLRPSIGRWILVSLQGQTSTLLSVLQSSPMPETMTSVRTCIAGLLDGTGCFLP